MKANHITKAGPEPSSPDCMCVCVKSPTFPDLILFIFAKATPLTEPVAFPRVMAINHVQAFTHQRLFGLFYKSWFQPD